MKLFFLSILLSFCGSTFASQISLKSQYLDQQPEILIKLPDSYETEKDKHYPVFIVLGGKDNVELVGSMLHRLHVSNGSNEHIVVGVKSTDPLNDLAPTVNLDPRGPVGAGGGADAFLNFIEIELVPFINKQYRVTNHKTISGHSVGGLLVIHAFHSRPSLFQAHLAFSPAVWWGKSETAEATKHYILSGSDTKSYLYLNIGTESGFMRDIYDSFTETLIRNRSIDLILKTEVYSESDHDFTFAAGLYSALRGLYKYQQVKGI